MNGELLMVNYSPFRGLRFLKKNANLEKNQNNSLKFFIRTILYYAKGCLPDHQITFWK